MPVVPAETETWAPPAAPPVVPPTATPTSASLQISLPAEARLLVGDYNTESTGSVRFFQSPPLDAGKTYAYELRADLNRGGRTITETKTIVVKAGQSANVDFTIDETYIAQVDER